MVELRRVTVDPNMPAEIQQIAKVVNRLVARDRGDGGGRIWLLGDDGDRREILGGAVLDSNNYLLRVEPTSTNQVNVLHSDGVTVGLRVQDAGLTTGVPVTLTSTLTVTGALAANGGLTTTTLVASGAATLNGAVTLGDNAADVITVTGTPTFAENVVMAKNLTVDTTTFVVDSVNNKVGVGAVPVSTDALLSVAGYIATTGNTGPPTTNADQVFLFLNGVAGGVLRALNPGTATHLPLAIDGLSVQIRASNTTRIQANSTGLGFFNTTPVAQPAAGAAATDPASTQALANALRTGLRNLGLFS